MKRGVDRFRGLITGLLHFVCRLNGTRVLGAENIPANEPLLIISNHTSTGDPPLISAFYRQPLTYIAKQQFAESFFTRTLFSALGAVFLNKEDGELAMMRAVLAELKAGRSVAIFPEGHRYYNQQLGEFQNGAAFIAFRAKVRVLPVAVVNSADFLRFWRRNVRLVVGEPLPIPDGKADREALQAETDRYKEIIAALFAEGRAQLQQEGRPMYITDKVRR